MNCLTFRQRSTAAGLLGASHFLVDFCCTCLLTQIIQQHVSVTPVLLALLYNGLAFAFQFPIGALADVLGRPRLFACIGCLLVALGCVLPLPVAACVLVGLGNAAFHIGGGKESLHTGGKLAGPVGVFVAPGAIGIFLGPLAAGISTCFVYIGAGILALCAVILFFYRPKSDIPALEKPKFPLKRLVPLMACMFLTVLLRSYTGTVLRYEFQSSFHWALLFSLCIFAGKFLGGVFADRFGSFAFALVSQTVCTALLALSVYFPFCAMPAIFLFNTTMALTASALYRALPQYGGTMFGLTTFALFLGIVPKLMSWSNVLFSWWGLLILGLCSTVFLLGGLFLGQREDRKC